MAPFFDFFWLCFFPPFPLLSCCFFLVLSLLLSLWLCHCLSVSLLFSSLLVTAAGLVQGRLLSQLGVAWCLTAGPLVAACLMAATAVYPNTYMIAIGEIVRKVGPL